MRILIATEFFPLEKITGGVEARAYYIRKELQRRHDVSVLTSRQPGASVQKDVIRIGPEFPYTSTGHLVKRVMFSVKLTLRMPWLIRKMRPDVIDCQSFFAYPAGLMARLLGKKVFFTYHEVWLGGWSRNTKSWLGFIGEIMERLILFKAALLGIRFISVSGFTASKLERAGIRRDRITVVHNGIDPNELTGTLKRDGHVLYAGRLVEHKRVQDLIAAAARLPGLRVDIAGDGPEKTKLMELAARLGVDDRVRFLGYIGRDDLVRRMKKAMILCHPGTVEGFGITLVESMACGTPYVCSDIPVFLEVTEKGKGGLIFRRMDPGDLASKIRRLMSDEKLYRTKKAEARELSKRYSWESIALRVEEAYR